LINERSENHGIVTNTQKKRPGHLPGVQ
jgi:hypothetical protein